METTEITMVANMHSSDTDETTELTTTTTTTTTTTLPPEDDREWEDLMLAGPLVVNYFNLLMVLVSRGSENLVIPENYTVQHVQNTGYLREVLYQLSSSMQSAFQMAYDDLFRTQNAMEQIPDHITATLFLIKSAQNNVLSELFPYPLRNTNRATNEGSTVSNPVVNKFIAVQSIIDELVRILDHTMIVASNKIYFTEANMYAKDIQTQWNVLVKLFRKFSERADLTQTTIHNNFTDPINDAKQANKISSASQRTGQLKNLVPSAVFIDQSAYLLGIMARTYSEISTDHVINQIAESIDIGHLFSESDRILEQRATWQRAVSQSVKVARLAQDRHDGFAATSTNRQAEYNKYLQASIKTK